MSILSNKFSKTFLISLSVVLALIICLLLFLGLVVENKKLSVSSELKGQRLIFSIPDENIVSRNSVINSDHDISSIIAQNDQQNSDNHDIANNSQNDNHQVVAEHNDHQVLEHVENVTVESKKEIDQAINPEKKKDLQHQDAQHQDALGRDTNMEDDRPAIAITIGGLGLSKSSTMSAISLPKEITLGFSPYASEIDKLSAQAAAAGHDVLINLPLEPMDYPVDDPGPMGLISDLQDEENIQRLKFILSLVPNIKGVYAIDEERFTRSVITTRAVFDELSKNRKLFLYGLGSRNSALQQLATKEGYTLLINDEILDEDISEEAINNKLSLLEDIAKKRGVAVAFGSPYPITTDTIQKWATTLDNKGIRLIRLEEIYNKQEVAKPKK